MKMQLSEMRQRLHDHQARRLKHGEDTVFNAIHQFRDQVDEQIRDTPAETRQALEAAHLQALANRKNLGWTKHLTAIVSTGLLLAGTAAGGIAGFALSFFPATVLGWEVGERCQAGRLQNNENRCLAFREAALAAEMLEQQPNLPISDLTLAEKLERHAQAKYDQGNLRRGAEYMDAAEIYKPFGTDYLEMRHRAFSLPASQLVIDETAPDTPIPAAVPLSPKAEQYDELRVQKKGLRTRAHQVDVAYERKGALAAAALTIIGGLAGAALGCWPAGLLVGVMAGAGSLSMGAQAGERQRDQAQRQIDRLSDLQNQLANGP